MKGTDTMNRQTNKVERQVMNLLSYWAAGKKDTGFIFIEHLPKEDSWETCQEVILISGRKFNIIYTQVNQAIWVKVLVQEQNAGRIHAVEVGAED